MRQHEIRPAPNLAVLVRYFISSYLQPQTVTWSFSYFHVQWKNLHFEGFLHCSQREKAKLNHDLLNFILFDQMKDRSTHRTQISLYFHKFCLKNTSLDLAAFPVMKYAFNLGTWFTWFPQNFTLKFGPRSTACFSWKSGSIASHRVKEFYKVSKQGLANVLFQKL